MSLVEPTTTAAPNTLHNSSEADGWIVYPDLEPHELRDKLGLVTEPELAGMLSVELETLQRWRREKTGPRWTRLGKRVFYHVDSLKQWVFNNEQDPETKDEAEDPASARPISQRLPG